MVKFGESDEDVVVEVVEVVCVVAVVEEVGESVVFDDLSKIEISER